MDAFDQMRTFVRIVDAGSLSAAARAGRLSLAAVSRQLSALEDELGTPLVVRTTRRLQITPSGRRWYEHCVRMLRELEQARADVRDSGDVRGTVVISAPVTLGTYRRTAAARARPRASRARARDPPGGPLRRPRWRQRRHRGEERHRAARLRVGHRAPVRNVPEGRGRLTGVSRTLGYPQASERAGGPRCDRSAARALALRTATGYRTWSARRNARQGLARGLRRGVVTW